MRWEDRGWGDEGPHAWHRPAGYAHDGWLALLFPLGYALWWALVW